MLVSIADQRKIVVLLVLNKNDADLSTECGFLKSDIHRFCLEFTIISMNQNEEYLDYFKKEEESFLKGF